MPGTRTIYYGVIPDGVVGKGQGLARQWMTDDPYLSDALGVNLYPGTLNVYVRGDHFMIGDGFDPGGARANGFVWALPCTVNGSPAFVVRNEMNGPESNDLLPPPRTLFEIVAEKCLCDVLGLRRGSTVVLEFDPSHKKQYFLRTSTQ